VDLILSHQDHSTSNGTMFKLEKHFEKPDKAIHDDFQEKGFSDELARLYL